MTATAPSVNRLAAPLLERLLREADRLRIAVTRDAGGVTLVDAGISAPGSIEAGLQIAELCRSHGDDDGTAAPRSGCIPSAGQIPVARVGAQHVGLARRTCDRQRLAEPQVRSAESRAPA